MRRHGLNAACAKAVLAVVQVRGKSEVQIAARDAIGHMDFLRERLNDSQEAVAVRPHMPEPQLWRISWFSRREWRPDCGIRFICHPRDPRLCTAIAPTVDYAVRDVRWNVLHRQVGDEALQLALEEQREQCAVLEARLATTQVSCSPTSQSGLVRAR